MGGAAVSGAGERKSMTNRISARNGVGSLATGAGAPTTASVAVSVATLVTALVASLGASGAEAATPGVVLRLGVQGGGDDLVELEFDGGGSERIDAGDATFVELELDAPLLGRVAPGAPDGLLTAFTLGLESASIDAANGDVTFSRVSLGLHQHLRFAGRFRAGAGLVWQPHVELDTDVAGVAGGDADFDPALGLRLSADWLVGRRALLGLRATFVDYEIDGGPEDGETVDGDSIGLAVGVRLR